MRSQLVFNPGTIPIPKSRDFTKFSNPEIPGLSRRDPGILKICFFSEILQDFFVFFGKTVLKITNYTFLITILLLSST